MTRTLTIDPLTRIEGHARVLVHLQDDGEVASAELQVTQFRGFEKICEGRPLEEIPGLMARICGICPVSHLLASGKACDAVLAVQIPPAAVRLRAILNLAQMVQSHALSVFYLSAPDLFLGMEAAPASRNLFGLLATERALVEDGIALRAFGQKLIEGLTGRRVHPGYVVPGGVERPMRPELQAFALAQLPTERARVERAIERLFDVTDRFAEEMEGFASFPSLFMGLVDERGHPESYDGRLRVADSAGALIEEVEAERATDLIGEHVEPGTFLKPTYYRPWGFPSGMFRVGPLARLNVVKGMGTPGADAALARLREKTWGSDVLLGSFFYHHARLVEMLFALERLEALFSDDQVLDDRVRAVARPNAGRGVGVVEAPRGLLIHAYQVDRDGLVESADLLVATVHNGLAMSRGVTEAARRYLERGTVTEGALNRIEAVIRCFDPCLSCSTHAVGQMPMVVTVVNARGEVVDRRARPESPA